MAAPRRKPRPTGDPVNRVLDNVRRLVRTIRASAQAAEETLGISGAAHYVLEALSRSPALSLNELAARTFTHKSSVSVVAANLVERGFVSRRTSPEDGRRLILALTPAGRRALGRLPDSAQTRMIEALERLGPGDLPRFATIFDRFVTELGVQDLEPTMLGEPGAGSRAKRGA
jgi:DNA-binding MarR family transcriptional regulator